MKTAIVTGSGGYIGSGLVKRLLDDGFRVRGIDRYFFGAELLKNDILLNKNFQLVQEDIRTVQATNFADADIVFDLAGLSNDPSCELDPKLTEQINFKGTVNVANCAKLAGVRRYIFSSSCSVYGTGLETALTEDSPLNPVSHYARAKAQAERALLDLASPDFSVSILRNGTVYGLSRRMRTDLIVNLMAVSAWRNRKIYVLGGGQQWRPLVQIDDVIEAFMKTALAERSLVHKQIFNVGSDEQNYQVFQVATLLKTLYHDVEIVTLPDNDDKRTYNVSFDKIYSHLGFNVRGTVKEAGNRIKDALESAHLNPSDPRNDTVKYYQYLIKAQDVMQRLSINGRILDCA